MKSLDIREMMMESRRVVDVFAIRCAFGEEALA